MLHVKLVFLFFRLFVFIIFLFDVLTDFFEKGFISHFKYFERLLRIIMSHLLWKLVNKFRVYFRPVNIIFKPINLTDIKIFFFVWRSWELIKKGLSFFHIFRSIEKFSIIKDLNFIRFLAINYIFTFRLWRIPIIVLIQIIGFLNIRKIIFRFKISLNIFKNINQFINFFLGSLFINFRNTLNRV